MKKLTTIIVWLLFSSTSLYAINKPSLQFTHRLRIETWDNAVNMDDESGNPTTYSRNRSSLGLNWVALPSTEFGMKLTHEFRYYISPKTTPFSRGEVIFDNLFLKWKTPITLPVTITAGRFNMWFGEGFVVADQSPLDGSRTGYFNGIRADVQAHPEGTLSAFYCQMDARDYALPVFNNQHQAMADRPEKGGGLYWQQKMGKNALHVYYLYHNQMETLASRERKTNTIGWRYDWRYTNGLYFITENAGQFDSDEDIGTKDIGGYTKLGREFSSPLWSLSKAEVGAVYLTEDWNPVWGRWPKWSESYIYTLSGERGVARWSNFTSVFAAATLIPSPETKLQLAYHYLGALESFGTVAPASSSAFSDGIIRGNLFMSRFDYKINPRLNGHFIAERFIPGDFYKAGSNSYVWLRTELFYTFDLKM